MIEQVGELLQLDHWIELETLESPRKIATPRINGAITPQKRPSTKHALINSRNLLGQR